MVGIEAFKNETGLWGDSYKLLKSKTCSGFIWKFRGQYQVITAASCVYNATIVKIYLGTLEIGKGEIIVVNRGHIKTHENFTLYQELDGLNVAKIINLPEKIKNFGSIEIVESTFEISPDSCYKQLITVYGYGLGHPVNGRFTELKRKQNVMYMSGHDCKTHHYDNTTRFVEHKNMCLVGENIFAYNADFGGPVVLSKKNLKYWTKQRVIAIITYTTSGKRDVITPLAQHYDWLSKLEKN